MLENALIEEFEEISANTCFSSSNENQFELVDHPLTKRTQICKVGDRQDVFVFNPKLKLITLLSIDGCMFMGETHLKCDFAIYDNKKICFGEIKQGKSKNSRALDQLEDTLKIFQSKIDFKKLGFEIEVYRFANLRIISNPRPSINATDINSKLRFSNLGAKYYNSGNIIEF